VRVTHPFHPLYGQQFELIGVHAAWGEARVWFVGLGGITSLPAAWTDAVAPDPFVVQAAGRAVFRLQDLLDLVQLVSHLRGGCQ
jgi:hypothetical protein